MLILNLVRSIDYLGNSINFTIKSKSTYKTFFGGVLSLGIYIITIMLFTSFGKDYIEKTNPSGYSQIMPSSETSRALNISKYPFLMGFQIEDMYWKNIEIEDYFHAIFFLRETQYKDGKFINIRNKLKNKPCDKINIGKDIVNVHVNLSKFTCPDLSELDNKTLYGNFDSDKFITIEFFIRICDENNTNCKDIEKVKNLTEGPDLWISFAIPTVSYNINNYTNSFTLEMHNKFNLFSPSRLQYNEFFFSQYESDTDSGDFFENIQREEAVGNSDIFSSNVEDHRLLDLKELTKDKNAELNSNNIYQGLIFFNERKFYYSRWYLKIPDVVANTAGIMEIIIFLLTFLYSFYSQFCLDKYLCNQLIYLHEEKKIDRNKIKNFFSIKNDNISKNSLNFNKSIQEIPLQKSPDVSNVNLKDANLNHKNLIEVQSERLSVKSDDSLIRKMIENRIERFWFPKNDFVFGILYYLKNKICLTKDPKMRKKIKVFDSFPKKFHDKLEIFYYLKLINKIKIWESTIFSQNQTQILSVLYKKNYRINLIEEEKNKDIITHKKKLLNIFNLIYRCNDIDLTETDERILNNLFSL